MKSCHSKKLFNLVVLILAMLPVLSMAENLSMRRAQQLALEHDRLSRGLTAQSQAFEDESVAADTWPDPKLKFGVLALPTDTYDLDQEPMTQLVLGYTQALPRGDTEVHMAGKMQAMASSKRHMAQLRQRQVSKMARMAWLQVYLQERSEAIIRKNRGVFEQQLEVSQSLYSAGRSNQQDVLQAQLEISLLDDRLEDIEAQKREARARLAQWVGTEAARWPLDTGASLFPSPPADELEALKTHLVAHPLMQAKQAMVNSAEAEVDISEEKYAPQWMFDVTYGKRDGYNMDGSDRADFLSAIVSLDIPLFTGNRQDRQLSASQKQLAAARYEQQDALIELQSQLEQAFARWQQLDRRLRLYDNEVLPRAHENARAAFNGYQSGVVPFVTLTRARSAELKSELQRLKLKVSKAMTLADIDFLAGELE